MRIKAVLFDLDGTLLPMDQEKFVKDYFGRIAAYLAPHGVDPKALVDAIWRGTAAMVKNDGSMTNENRFWSVAESLLGSDIRSKECFFDAFYAEQFDNVKHSCGYDPAAAPLIKELKARGYRVILATNPIFPGVATRKRIAWAGLSPEDFELVTVYENSSFSKPSLDYYRNILAHAGLSGEDCLMVGNDVGEDMVAAELGMSTYLVTRDLINRAGADISTLRKGNLDGVLDYLDELERA